ncbi:poly-gamma-glutamate biosynthesis protein PgsC/CapC [Halococcus sediminicola]|uniref:poly-gamma-glutamate biosynthesis protein PgsC/CapC n=1 Tax=Halococcus sediminicola TaxID=1264579 RepID=UPI000679C6F0|nr:poly-gamma-glutamate biosynthesis protein PgsC/CapC [Halococcus sediminicola]
MIVAAMTTALGLLLVGVITQLFGYRLGGTIGIPMLAVYTLKNVFMLPIFIVSTIIAYAGLYLAKHRTLIYGRDELLVAMGIGSGVPLVIFVVLGEYLPRPLRFVLFIGSILPGLAAFNYHQLKPEYRKWDLITAILLFSGLFGLGWLLIDPRFTSTLSTLTPPALYAETADVAVWKNAAVPTELEPIILTRPRAVALFLVGFLITERVRDRYGLRIGLISVALLAIYALSSKWLLVLYAVTLALGFVFLWTIHHVTLLYGRVLISITTAFTLLVALPLVALLPITRGLSAYFVVILAGINAYNWHTAPNSKRKLFVPIQFGTFTLLLVLARSTGRILPRGIPQEFGLLQIGLGALVVAVCLGVVEYYTVDQPSRERVFEASILSGGSGDD